MRRAEFLDNRGWPGHDATDPRATPRRNPARETPARHARACLREAEAPGVLTYERGKASLRRRQESGHPVIAALRDDDDRRLLDCPVKPGNDISLGREGSPRRAPPLVTFRQRWRLIPVCFQSAFKPPENRHARAANVLHTRFARTRGKIVSLKRGEARPTAGLHFFRAFGPARDLRRSVAGRGPRHCRQRPRTPSKRQAEKEEAPTGGRGFFGSLGGTR